MRLLFLCLSVLPLFASAQNCRLKKSVDPYTKETRLSTGMISLDGTNLSIEADSKEIDFFFSMVRQETCFNDASTAVVSYDSTRIKGTFRNGGSVNCEGFFHIIFRNSPGTNALLNRLITQKITSIVLTSSATSKTTIELSSDDAQKVRYLAQCLVTEAKTLIKQ
jgi:hypothetical protein